MNTCVVMDAIEPRDNSWCSYFYRKKTMVVAKLSSMYILEDRAHHLHSSTRKVSLSIQFTKDRIECFDGYFLIEKRDAN